jgi:hypothetical protein
MKREIKKGLKLGGTEAIWHVFKAKSLSGRSQGLKRNMWRQMGVDQHSKQRQRGSHVV